MTSNIPDDVRRFLLAAIPSVPHLEALLLLRAETGQRWDGAQLARRLYIDERSAGRLLADLETLHLLRRHTGAAADGGVQEVVSAPRAHWAYGPADAALESTVASLAGVYARHVVEVAELIHSSPDRKAQRFAEAFRLRKDT